MYQTNYDIKLRNILCFFQMPIQFLYSLIWDRFTISFLYSFIPPGVYRNVLAFCTLRSWIDLLPFSSCKAKLTPISLKLGTILHLTLTIYHDFQMYPVRSSLIVSVLELFSLWAVLEDWWWLRRWLKVTAWGLVRCRLGYLEIVKTHQLTLWAWRYDP